MRELAAQVNEPQAPRKPPDRKPKQVQRRLNPDEQAELAAAYVAGLTLKQLSAWFRIHHRTVAAILERMGIPRRNHALTARQVGRAARFYAAGDSVATLGERFGVDGTSARNMLVRAPMSCVDDRLVATAVVTSMDARSCEAESCAQPVRDLSFVDLVRGDREHLLLCFVDIRRIRIPHTVVQVDEQHE